LVRTKDLKAESANTRDFEWGKGYAIKTPGYDCSPGLDDSI